MRRYLPLILICIFTAALPWIIAESAPNPTPETTSTTSEPATTIPSTTTARGDPTTTEPSTTSTNPTTSTTTETTSSTTTLFSCPGDHRQETVDGKPDCVPKNCFIDIPFHRQEEAAWCGPAVVQMISGYYGVSRTQANLAAAMKTGNITDVGMLTRLFIVFDYRVNVTRGGDPKEKLEILLDTVCRHGTPVVVLQRTTVNDTTYGHYRIVVGYDIGRVFVIDPIYGLASIDVNEFYGLWRHNAQVESDNVALTPIPI